MTSERQKLTIRESGSGRVLVEASPERYQKVEGNWYVDPAAVKSEFLVTTTHEYRCPYKGRCFYVDFHDGNNRAERVAWIYDYPKPGWEHIQGQYGFYAGETAAKFGKTEEHLSPGENETL